MSCYFRHLGEIFQEAGLQVTPSNKRRIDQAIHRIVEVDYKDCPVAWKKLKRDVIKDEGKRRDFVARLKEAIGSGSPESGGASR